MSHRRSSIAKLVIVPWLLLTGCGGGDEDDVTCSTFAGCGGAVEGKWAVAKTCAPAMLMIPTDICGDIAVDFSTAQSVGEVTFAKDGTYTGGVGLSGTAKVMLPSECLTIAGQQRTCAQVTLGIALAQTQDPQLAALGKVECTGTTTCSCIATLPGTPQTTGGTYATSGTTLTLTPTGEEPQNVPYCVKDGRLEAALAFPGGAMPAGAPAHVILRRK